MSTILSSSAPLLMACAVFGQFSKPFRHSGHTVSIEIFKAAPCSVAKLFRAKISIPDFRESISLHIQSLKVLSTTH
jgi:hypothetical protein